MGSRSEEEERARAQGRHKRRTAKKKREHAQRQKLKARAGGKKGKKGKKGGGGGDEEEGRAVNIFWCCTAAGSAAQGAYHAFLDLCDRQRPWTLFFAWLLTGWAGGHLVYLGEYEDAAGRWAGLLAVWLLSGSGLSFCLIPILVVVWVADWRALPVLLWRFEGGEGPVGGGGEKRGGGAADGLTTLLAPAYSISGVMPAFEYCDATSGGAKVSSLDTVSAPAPASAPAAPPPHRQRWCQHCWRV